MGDSLQQLWQFVLDWQHQQNFWVMAGALSGAVSAVIITIAALVAAFQLGEARRLRSAQVRPFVVIEFRPEPSSVIFLRISNLGSTMARDVRFEIDPPLVTTRGEDWNVMKLQIFKSGIDSLAPGRVIETFFDSFIGRSESNDRHKVTVRYNGEGGRKYRETLDLDLGVFRDTKNLITHGLDDIYKEVKNIATSLDDFKASGGGLLVLSPQDLAKRREDWDESIRERIEEDRMTRAPSPALPQDPNPRDAQPTSDDHPLDTSPAR